MGKWWTGRWMDGMSDYRFMREECSPSWWHSLGLGSKTGVLYREKGASASINLATNIFILGT